jgi:hypothetical protein
MKTRTIDPAALYWATFNHCEFRIPGTAIIDICHPGDAQVPVEHHTPEIRRLTAELYADSPGNPWNPTPDTIRKELAEYGSWDEEELADDDQNWHRLVWLAAWDIFEDECPDCEEPSTPTPAP